MDYLSLKDWIIFIGLITLSVSEWSSIQEPGLSVCFNFYAELISIKSHGPSHRPVWNANININ